MIKNTKIVEISKLLVDLCATNVSFGIANYIVFNHFWVDGWAYPSLFICVNLSVLISYYTTKQELINPSFSISKLIEKSFYYCIVISILVSIYWLLIYSVKYYWIHLVLFLVFNFVIVFFLKSFWKIVLKKILSKIYTPKRVLIIGSQNSSIELKKILEKNKWSNYRVIFIRDLHSDFQELNLYIEQLNIQVVILNLENFVLNSLAEKEIIQILNTKTKLMLYRTNKLIFEYFKIESIKIFENQKLYIIKKK